MNIDSVQEGSADLLLVPGDGTGGATARFDRVIAEAAGAPVRVAVATNFLYLGCALAMSLGSRTDGTLQEKTLHVDW